MDDVAVTEDSPHPGGRPTDYRDHFPEQAYKLCLLGATDEDMADFFGVVTSTFYEWKNRYPEFAERINEGKKPADMQVAKRLFDRATGQTVKKQQAIKVKEEFFDDTGKKIKTVERIQVVDLEDEMPADVKAQIYWLNNRTKNWRDKQDHELTGKDGIPLTNEITVTVVKPALTETEQ